VKLGHLQSESSITIWPQPISSDARFNGFAISGCNELASSDTSFSERFSMHAQELLHVRTLILWQPANTRLALALPLRRGALPGRLASATQRKARVDHFVFSVSVIVVACGTSRLEILGVDHTVSKSDLRLGGNLLELSGAEGWKV
jgi:hypothetical protein